MKKIKDLPQITEELIRSMSRKSEKTITTYKTGINFFISYIKETKGEEFLISDLKFIDIEDYKIYLENHTYKDGKKYGTATINNRISSLKALFKHMVKRGYVENNPASEVEMLKNKTKMPKTLTMQEAMKVLRSLRNSADKNKERDIAIITVFLNCGLRSAELRNLDVKDVDLKNRVLRVVNGKGGKDRNIMLNDATVKAIREYLIARSHTTSDSTLFLSSRDQKITEGGIKFIVSSIFEKAGIEGASPHSLRHTAGTEYYRATGDIRKVQKLLGHTNISTTQIYTEVYDEDMKDMVEMNIFGK